MTSVPPPGYEDAGGSWGFSQTGRAPEPPPDPLSRRLFGVVYGLSALLIALVAVAWLHGGEEASLNPIAEAAERTAATAGARMDIRASYTVPGRPLELAMRGEGVFDGRTGRAELTMSMSLPGGRLGIEAVSDRDALYLRSPIFAGELPPGKEWMGMEPLLGHDPQTAFAGGSDLDQQLQVLKATGADVEKVREETVRGVPTTLYHGTIDLRRAVTMLRREGEGRFAAVMRRIVGLGPSRFPVWAWIDEDGILRRTRQIQAIPTGRGGPAMEMDMQVDLYDFGIEPDIELPPAGDVFDATPLIQAQLGLFGKGSGREAAPVGAPLPQPVFRARVGEICREVKRDARPLERKVEALGRRAGRLARTEGPGSPVTERAFRRLALDGLEPLADLFTTAGLDRFERVAPPEGLAGAYRRYVRLSALQVEVVRALSRAMEVGEFGLIDRLDERLDGLAGPVRRLAGKIGAGACEDTD